MVRTIQAMQVLMPHGNKKAKKLRVKENAFKAIAYAQRDMAATNKDRVTLLEEQSLHNLFSLKVADVDAECRVFFKISRQKRNGKIQAENSK